MRVYRWAFFDVIIRMTFFFWFLVSRLILKGTHVGEIVFVCVMLDEWWDLGGLTLHVLVVWLLRKWGKRREIGILSCYEFSLI